MPEEKRPGLAMSRRNCRSNGLSMNGALATSRGYGRLSIRVIPAETCFTIAPRRCARAFARAQQDVDNSSNSCAHSPALRRSRCLRTEFFRVHAVSHLGKMDSQIHHGKSLRHHYRATHRQRHSRACPRGQGIAALSRRRHRLESSAVPRRSFIVNARAAAATRTAKKIDAILGARCAMP